MDPDRRDLLGDDPDDDVDAQDDDRDDGDRYDDGTRPGPGSVLGAVLAPEALAVASLVLAVASLLGLGLLNGSPYFAVFTTQGGPAGQSTFLLSALLGAGLALVPALLGVAALRRLPQGSPSLALAGAGVLVAAVSVVLRLVIAARTAADDTVQYSPF